MKNSIKDNKLIRTLRYRKHISILSNVLAISLICLGLFIAIVLFYALRNYPLEDNNLLIFSIFITLLIIIFSILFIEYFYYIRPLKYTVVSIFSYKVNVNRKNESLEILFHDISKVELKGFSFLKSIRIFLKNGFTYDFSLSLERPDYLIDAIYNHNSNIIHESYYKDLREKLILRDHSFSRFIELIGLHYSIILVFIVFVLPSIFIFFLYLNQKNFYLIKNLNNYFFKTSSFIFIISIFWAIFFVLLADFTLMNRKKKDLKESENDKKRDRKAEIRLYHFLLPIFVLFIFLNFFIIFKYDINLKSVYSLERPYYHFDLRRGDWVWIDKRYNCFNCDFTLDIRDLIIYQNQLDRKKYIGEIMALPGDNIKKFNLTKYLKVVVVPNNKVLLKTENKKVVLDFINTHEIIGRVHLENNFFNQAVISEK